MGKSSAPAGPRDMILIPIGFGLLSLLFVAAWMWLAFGPAGLGCVVVGVALPVLLVWQSKAASAANARRALEDDQEDWMDFLDEYPAETHEAITRMTDPHLASLMWSAMGLGRAPVYTETKHDPGAWPLLVPGSIENTRIGIRVRLELLHNQSARTFVAKIPEIAKAFKVPAVRVLPAHGQQVALELQVYEPLSEMFVTNLFDDATRERIKAAALSGGTEAEISRAVKAACVGAVLQVAPGSLSCMDDIQLMVSEHAELVTINLAKGAHFAIQGASRSGKSITINTLLAWASLMRDVRVVIIDPNTAAVAPWWRTAYRVCNSTDAEKATELLEEIIDELRAREDLFWEGETDRISEFSEDVPLYLIVIDEVAEYSKHEPFQAALKKAGAQLAKYGGRVVPAGQKLAGTEISTSTRANLFDRICHRVEDVETMRHLFPKATQMIEQGLDATADAMPQGVAVVRLRSNPEPVRARSVYLPTEACYVISAAIVAAFGEVRPRPSTRALPAPPTTKALGSSNSNQSAITIEPPVSTSKPEKQPKKSPRASREIPAVPQVERDRKVIPLRKGDDTKQPAAPDAESTGTD
ncbi:FtsK/SpoIIIE domain-containing protein [Nocardia fluminea]|uniref:FtsK/SpoIIIE domain-containing protein n=1 Tax=Nocardia fluminea TaxID=134984 RepID=UPI00365BB804